MATKLDWNSIDSQLFVNLVADLLRERGYINIQYQGDGPDGGLDLFATQIINSLGFQEHLFHWGIQCKFSASGQKKAVNDSEIRDVEGILRSERYSSHNLDGYMLVTNRRISQNIIERLRGINISSPFRTSAIDGNQFQLLLIDHPNLTERYFVYLANIASKIDGPFLLSDEVSEDGPAIPVQLLSSNRSKFVSAKAVLGSGAITYGPSAFLEELTPLRYTRAKIRSFAGTTEMLVYRLILEIGDGKIFSGDIDYLAIESAKRIYLASDISRQLTILIDGPRDFIHVWGQK